MPQPLYPRERTPVPIHYESGYAPDPVWAVLEKTKSLFLLKFDPRTVQPVASRYIAHATPPPEVWGKVLTINSDYFFGRN